MLRRAIRLLGRVAGLVAAAAGGYALYRAGRLDSEIEARIQAARMAAIESALAVGPAGPVGGYVGGFGAEAFAGRPAVAAEEVGWMGGRPVVGPGAVAPLIAGAGVAGAAAAVGGTAAGGAAAGAEAEGPPVSPVRPPLTKAERKQRRKQAKRDMIDRTGRGYRAAGLAAISLLTLSIFGSFAVAGYSALTGGQKSEPVSTEEIAGEFEPGEVGGGTPFQTGQAPVTEQAAAEAGAEGGGGEGAGGTGEAQGGGVALLIPPQGTYTYKGSGTEKDATGTKQQGPEMPATVKHAGNNCWEFKMHYHSDRWAQDTYCAGTDGSLAQTRTDEELHVKIAFYEETVTIDIPCDPPSTYVQSGMQPGTTFNHTCYPTNSAVSGETKSSGTATFVAEESLNVGGQSVAAYKIEQNRTISGTQTGTEKVTLWFAKDNGLPLANERDITVNSPLPFGLPGSTTSTEKGSYVLQSLTPQ